MLSPWKYQPELLRVGIKINANQLTIGQIVLRLVVCLYSLKGTCPLSNPGPWRIDCVLKGGRSLKCFKVVSLKAGQVRQFTCARLKTEVGIVSMIDRDILLFAAARL